MLKILLIVIVVIVVSLLAFSKYILNMVFNVRYDGNPNLIYKTNKDFKGLKADDVTFKSGENVLKGSFYYTDKNYKDLVIFTHGFGEGHHAYTTEINTIANNGHLVFSYDNTGCVNSEGKSIISFYQAVKDLKAAFNYLEETEYNNWPIKCVGHSWGGYTAINSLTISNKVEKVAAFAPLNDPTVSICDTVGANLGFNANFLMPFIKFWLWMLDKENGYRSCADILANTDKKVLVVQGTKDQSVFYKSSVAVDQRVIDNKNVTISIKEDRLHNPYQSKRSEDYLVTTFSKISELAKSKKPEDKIELEKMYKNIDYSLITEEDEETMKEFLNFIK